MPESFPHANGRAEPWDLVTIGFGPSGLALAVALEEADMRNRSLFLEQKGEFSWHEGMLLEGARIQVSCLKDLATLRNPRSRFTFLNYLKSVGRLDEFVNMATLRPTRLEFNDYLRWVARELCSSVTYSTPASAVEPVTGADGEIVALDVTAFSLERNRVEHHLARNLVLAAGARPKAPEGLELAGSERVFHSNEFLQRIAARFADRECEHHFLVVGDGQSGAEVFDFLAARYPRAHVSAATRGIGYRAKDETPFVNEAFFPSAVDIFHHLSEAKRASILASLRNLNYGVVDRELIDRIYRRVYDAKVAGERTLEIRPFLEFRSASDTGAGVVVEFDDQLGDRTVRLEPDAVVLATGYAVPSQHPLLAKLSVHLEVDTAGRYRLDRDYRIRSREGFWPGIFLQGYAEETHGISDTLLSLASMRAWEICTSVRESIEAGERRHALPPENGPVAAGGA